MANRQLRFSDYLFGKINAQAVVSGTSIDVQDGTENLAYFITALDGATASNPVTVKDKDGTTITIKNEEDVDMDIRSDGGFQVTAASKVYVRYFTVAIGTV